MVLETGDREKYKYLVGVDEAGRGPLAGPVVVVALSIPRESDILKKFNGIRDSKQLSPQKREEWFKKIKKAREMELLDYAVSFAGASLIDKRGIMHGIRQSLARSLEMLALDPKKTEIRLDGSLYAPKHFLMQRTIIRGDETERIIAMASVVAKVLRDKKMVRFAQKFPLYGFERHKGYGTKEHYTAIKRRGLCSIHRLSFL